MQSPLLTPKQVADLLQVRLSTVRAYLQTGRLIGHKVGNLWRVSEADLQSFIESLKKTKDSESEMLVQVRQLQEKLQNLERKEV